AYVCRRLCLALAQGLDVDVVAADGVPLRRLFREVGETRETAPACERCDDVEESLAALERLVSLNLLDGLRMVRARVVAPTGVLGQRRGRAPHRKHGQPRLAQQSLVLSRRYEQEVTNRAANGDLVAAEETSHDDGIGEKQPTLRPKQASPISENTRSIG